MTAAFWSDPPGVRLVALAFGGAMAWVLIVWRLSHRRVMTPLHRMAEEVRVMQRTGRWTKFSGPYADDLGIVAAGFNRLVAQNDEQRRRGQDQISELERVNAELGQLATLKEEFLETINHQLRTPITTVLETIQLMRDGSLGPFTEEQHAFVLTMEQQAKQLASLVEEVLDLSLLTSGHRPLQRQPADLAALLRQLHASWRGQAPSWMIRLSLDELPPVYMDATAIQEVTDHLLRNALRHAPKQSEILIAAHVHDGVVDVSIRDQGPGMSREQLARLFQPFVHVHTPEAPGSQGSGLGLAFCRQVIERHRGAIRAESTQGQGTTFTFSLPIASKQFLFEEACRRAQEDAEYEAGQFGLLLVIPIGDADPSLEQERMRRAEVVLRRHTHRGDQFVWLDDSAALAILAVTDQVGLQAMRERLRGLLSPAQVGVDLITALFPVDGDSPERLLEAAMRRIPEPLRSRLRASIRRQKIETLLAASRQTREVQS